MMAMNDDRPKTINETQVVDYLRSHPDLLVNYPELLKTMTPPTRSLGDGVVDFQQFQLKNLQENSRDMKERLEGLLEYCRGTLSLQSQVHEVVLRILRCKSLEQLIEVLAIDMPNVLMVDVARLVIESDESELKGEDVEGMYHSGLTLVPKDTVMLSIGHSPHQLIADLSERMDEIFEEITYSVFGGIAPVIKSAGFFAVPLASLDHSVMLALGCRESGRFKPGANATLLDFLANAIASKLDGYLNSLDI